MELGSIYEDRLMDLTKRVSFKQKIAKVFNKGVKIKPFITKLAMGEPIHL